MCAGCAAGLDRLRRALLARALKVDKKKVVGRNRGTQGQRRTHADVYAGFIKGAPFFLAV